MKRTKTEVEEKNTGGTPARREVVVVAAEGNPPLVYRSLFPESRSSDLPAFSFRCLLFSEVQS